MRFLPFFILIFISVGNAEVVQEHLVNFQCFLSVKTQEQVEKIAFSEGQFGNWDRSGDTVRTFHSPNFSGELEVDTSFMTNPLGDSIQTRMQVQFHYSRPDNSLTGKILGSMIRVNDIKPDIFFNPNVESYQTAVFQPENSDISKAKLTCRFAPAAD